MALNISRVTALPDPLVANTIYLLAISPTEVQVVVVGNNVADVRKTVLVSDVDGKITTALTTAAADATTKAAAAQAAAIADAALDATAKASAAQSGAIGTAAADATTKADAAQAAAIAAAALDATTKADAAQAAAAVDATDKAAAAVTAAAADATTKADAAEADAIAAAALDATTKATAAQSAAITAAAAVATTKANAAKAAAATYTDSAVSSAIGNFDQSNSAVYAANIAARDALTLTKNSFVLVADASADEWVEVGAALYFYNVSDDSFMRIAEYESLDLVIPNQDILENLSALEGVLSYMGNPIGTVVAGETQW